MRVTSTEEYGLRCLLLLAREHEAGKALTLPEIASREGLPIPNTAKLLRRLRLAGIISAARGRTGGHALARSPREISLAEALAALDGPIFQGKSCSNFSGLEQVCVHTKDCSVRTVWSALHALVGSALTKITLADLVFTEKLTREKLRASWITESELEASFRSTEPVAPAARRGSRRQEG
jgi:Rrf2 family transcriptional regulator, iron-sulfur cluster assembly transcription factor